MEMHIGNRPTGNSSITLTTNPILAFGGVVIDSGNVRLLATAVSANSTSYTVSETLMV